MPLRSGIPPTVVLAGTDDGEGLYLGSPILIDDEVYGVLGFWSSDAALASRPHPQAREVIEMMARSIAAAAHQRQLTDQLAHQATHDALTGLKNRLWLQRELDRCLNDARGKGKLLAIVFIDLDRFKQINDTLGTTSGIRCWNNLRTACRTAWSPGTRWLAWAATSLRPF